MRKTALGLAMLATSVSAKTPPAPIDPGPPPTSIPAARQSAEQAMAASFFDPSSAQFQWPYDFTGGAFKPLLQAKVPGWVTCGLVNAKNRMGGYVGFRPFVVVINNDRVAYTAVSDGGDFDVVAAQCQNALKTGFLHPAAPDAPAPADGYVTPAAPPNDGVLGIQFTPVPFGVMLMNVRSGSPADKAGLKEGEVVTAINGIPIKGFANPQVQAVLSAPIPTITLTVTGVGDVKVERPTS